MATLFIHPLVIERFWLWLLLPLLLVIAVVWKSLKTGNLRRLPLEIGRFFLLEVGGMAGLAIALYLIVYLFS